MRLAGLAHAEIRALQLSRRRQDGITNPTGPGRPDPGRRLSRKGAIGRVAPMPSLGSQVALLFVLAMPVACVAWTVTHEEIFREPRDYCVRNSKACRWLLQRKFFYLFTCEYCFSHWVTIVALAMTGFKLVL